MSTERVCLLCNCVIVLVTPGRSAAALRIDDTEHPVCLPCATNVLRNAVGLPPKPRHPGSPRCQSVGVFNDTTIRCERTDGHDGLHTNGRKGWML